MSIKEKKEQAFKEKYFLMLNSFRNGGNFASVRLQDIQGGYTNWAKSQGHIAQMREWVDSLGEQLFEAQVALEEFMYEKEREEILEKPTT